MERARCNGCGGGDEQRLEQSSGDEQRLEQSGADGRSVARRSVPVVVWLERARLRNPKVLRLIF
jgi:hypothetical protein